MNKKGQTLLEVIVATGVLSVGLVAVLGLVTQSLLVSGSSKYRTQATFFAQEPIEKIETIRNCNLQAIDEGTSVEWDQNFYTQDGWYDDGFTLTGSPYVYEFLSVTEEHDYGGIWEGLYYHKLDGKVFHRYTHITKYQGREDARLIEIKVTWPDSRGTSQIEISRVLTEWR